MNKLVYPERSLETVKDLDQWKYNTSDKTTHIKMKNNSIETKSDNKFLSKY